MADKKNIQCLYIKITASNCLYCYCYGLELLHRVNGHGLMLFPYILSTTYH